jgi:hypothetical protein
MGFKKSSIGLVGNSKVCRLLNDLLAERENWVGLIF